MLKNTIYFVSESTLVNWYALFGTSATSSGAVNPYMFEKQANPLFF